MENIEKQTQFNNENLIEGVVCGSEHGYAFLRNPDGDYYIAKQDKLGAYHGDTVLCKEVKSHGHSRQAKVIKVLQRGNSTVVGTFEKVKSGGFVIPDEKKFSDDIFIPYNKCAKAKTGDKVECKITAYFKRNNPEGEIVEVIGRQFDTDTEIKCIVKSNKLPTDFPKQVIEESKLCGEVTEADILQRTDFRFKQVITIDGEDARDFDDAISIEKSGDDYILGVHIADVTHYVKPDSELDKEAFKRSTSVYFPEFVIPMLPKRLSNNICSLMEGKDRLTLSCVMRVGSDGEVKESQVVEGVINSSARMTYTAVAKILEGDEKLIKKHAEILPTINLMNELCQILIEKRAKRGSIDLDIKESKISVDKNGDIQVSLFERTIANRMIEEFMILANETVAETYFYLDIPFIYRIHEKPSIEKLVNFKAFIQELGMSPKWKTDTLHPKDFSVILDKFKGTPLFSLVNRVMLRSMQKAKYSPEDVGHFGLSSKHYSHFTSPIRRYPDLAIHRIIKSVLKGEIESLEEKYSTFVQEASIQSSTNERKAQDAERAVDDYYKMLYMSYRIGEEYDGIVSGVTNFGVFVELPNTVEGLVRIETLTGGRYEYDDKKMTLKNKKYEYKLGSKVKIIVAGIDVSSRRAEFIIKDNFFKNRKFYGKL